LQYKALLKLKAMKKNDFILIIAVAIYSYLFYQQLAGINFLIFSFSLVILLFMKDQTLWKNRNWLILAAGSLISGVFVFMHGSTLAIIANIVSLLLLAAISLNRKSSVIAAFIHSLYSEASSIPFMIIDIVVNSHRREKSTKKNVWVRLTLGLVIILIILVMFILYQKANPLFYNFTKDINLDFISFEWIRFTLLGFIILYAFFYQRTFPAFQRFDTNAPGKLSPSVNSDDSENKKRRKFMGIETEWKAGITLLALLNILILSVNVIDINYLWAGHVLPEGVTMADSLHQAVGTIIFSIIIAIGVLLFIFRSDMNFYKKNKLIKILALVWIIQNMFIVVSTLYRNRLYIDEFTLTYKRIGVYVYLALTFAGLISAMVKVASARSNWYLFRFNGWSFYAALIILPAVNWDMYITNYNLKYSKQTDMKYIFDLSSANLPELIRYGEKNDLALLTTEKKNNEFLLFDLFNRDGVPVTYKNLLDKKIYDFAKKNSNRDWRSWCTDRQNVKDELLALSASGSISYFDLSGNRLNTIEPLKEFTGTTRFDLHENTISDMNSFKYFSKLKILNLSSNQITSIDSIPDLATLEELDLSRNNIKNFDSLAKLKALTSLNISANGSDIKSLPALSNMQYLNISENKIKDFSFLEDMKSLKSLLASNINNSDFANLSIPENIEELYISGNNISVFDKILFDKIGQIEKLEILDISNNNLDGLEVFIKNKKESANEFSKLKTLYVSDNNLTEISDIGRLSNLEEFYAANNKITSVDEIQKLEKINAIYVSNNQIHNIDALQNIKGLKILNISNNPLTDYKKLEKLTGLEKLFASKLGISDLAFIEPMSNLTWLDISDNNISDLTKLKKMTQLETLDISKNPVKDFSAIMGLKNLKTLYISSVDDITLNKIRTALPDTKIYMNNSPVWTE
jgi:Leucine-rich repeat (LRR) protein